MLRLPNPNQDFSLKQHVWAQACITCVVCLYYYVSKIYISRICWCKGVKKIHPREERCSHLWPFTFSFKQATTSDTFLVFYTFLKIKTEATSKRFPCLENIVLPTLLCHGSCASSPEILPWCTCDWVTGPELQHGARMPWLMFYKLPRGPRTNAVPIFPPCCMHSAWDYIPQFQLLPQTMNSHRDDSHLTNPRTPRTYKLRKGGFTAVTYWLCLFVLDSGWLKGGGEVKQHVSCYQAGRAKCVICVTRTPVVMLEHLSLSLSSWLVNLFTCQM